MFPHPRVGREGSDKRAPRSSSAGAVERLSLVEVVVAELGGWAGALCYRCHLPLGPFLASDGVVHMDLAVFCDETRERGEASAPE